MLMPFQQNSFTHLKVQLVLTDRGISYIDWICLFVTQNRKEQQALALEGATVHTLLQLYDRYLAPGGNGQTMCVQMWGGLESTKVRHVIMRILAFKRYIIINILKPAPVIGLHIQEPHWYSKHRGIGPNLARVAVGQSCPSLG
jgi:hypothetical protein